MNEQDFIAKGFVRRPDGQWIKPPRNPVVQEILGVIATFKNVKSNLTIHPSTDESKLNKLERRFLNHLRTLQYPWIGIQEITLKIGDDCRYSPDLSTIDENGQLVFWEVKGGFFRDDAKVKLQVAARKFSWARFVLVRWKSGQWQQTEIKP